MKGLLMDIGGESERRATANSNTVQDTLAKRGFHNIKGNAGTFGQAHLFYNNEHSSLPLQEMLPLIQSATSEDALWSHLRKVNAVRPK